VPLGPYAVWVWNNQTTLDAYAFSYEQTCRCIHRGPWLVRIQDDSIINVETEAGGTVPSADAQEYIPTFDELFDKIQKGIDLNSAEVRVTYHETLGYSELVFIDYNEPIADKAFSARVDYFAPVGSWQPELDQGKQTPQVGGSVGRNRSVGEWETSSSYRPLLLIRNPDI
jgi:hypothetical protein